MKTSLPLLLAPLARQVLVALAAGGLAASLPARAEEFTTGPQRGDVTQAASEAATAADKASEAQGKAPTDAGQAAINNAEDTADAASNAADRAADAAEQAQQTADDLAKTAKTKDEIKAAKDAADAAREARREAKRLEDLAKAAERAAKAAVDAQVQADKGANLGRRNVHTARERQRQARRLLSNAIRRLDHTWHRTKLDPPKEGVTFTEEERRKTQEKINEGRGVLGLPGRRIIAAAAPVLPPNTLASLVAARKIQTDLTGTGRTIGHIANLRVKNLTDEKLSVFVPPMVLESKSGKTQHYVTPRSETVALTPQQEKVIPQRGICISRSKPPVGDGVGGDLLVNDGSKPGAAFTPAQVNDLIRGVTSYYDGAAKLEKEGKLQKVPYKDPEQRREIVTQWGVWSDPKICTLTGEKPAAKEDLSKVVYKQTAERGPVTPAIKEKLDTGITDIFASIQLTTQEAKNLEPADPFPGEPLPPGVINIDNPPPATEPAGRAPTPRADPAVPDEKILQDLVGALMNRVGLLESALKENPELAAKVERWLRAKERMERLNRERTRRAEAMRQAERMREEARKLRSAARNEANAQKRATLEATATSMDQGATAAEAGSVVTPDQRKEGREAEKEFQEAEAAVPPHIKTEVDNALKEQAAPPPPREPQERVEVGPDGKIIESPSKR
jgi:hypothetical protein